MFLSKTTKYLSDIFDVSETNLSPFKTSKDNSISTVEYLLFQVTSSGHESKRKMCGACVQGGPKK